mmetsp:Transcript_56702/g.157900  ORF Transcript_56702/g.157900 Transcript_56702/m.157900 type:complete len:233 (-) Transcript_56702:264-962(-)
MPGSRSSTAVPTSHRPTPRLCAAARKGLVLLTPPCTPCPVTRPASRRVVYAIGAQWCAFDGFLPAQLSRWLSDAKGRPHAAGPRRPSSGCGLGHAAARCLLPGFAGELRHVRSVSFVRLARPRAPSWPSAASGRRRRLDTGREDDDSGSHGVPTVHDVADLVTCRERPCGTDGRRHVRGGGLAFPVCRHQGLVGEAPFPGRYRRARLGRLGHRRPRGHDFPQVPAFVVGGLQ